MLDPARTAASILLAAVLLAAGAQGQEVFGIGREMVPVAAGPIVGVADFDGDGDVDLLGYSTGVWLNDGHGRFSPHPTPSIITGTGAVAIADFNGDGLPDVVRGTSLVTTTLAAWVSTGGGVLLQQAGLLPPLSNGITISCLAAGDVDGDGDKDLVIGRAGLPLVLWLNLGAMLFGNASTQLPPGLLSPWQMQLVDLDGDGDRDLLMTNNPVLNPVPSANRIVMTNDGMGVFTTSPNLFGAGAPTSLFTTGDVNGDQLPDVVFFSGLSGAVTLFVNNGPGLAFSPSASLGFGAPLLVDVDNDGADELLLARSDAGVQLFHVGPGPAIFGPLQTLNLFPSAPPFASDFDGDGDRDVILPAVQAHRLLLNTGQGLTEVPGCFSAPATGATMLAGDLEGDGDVDVIAPYAAGIGVARNDGNGQLDWEPSLPCSGACVGYGANDVVHAFDADGDGDLDLYVAEPLSAPLPYGDRLLLNTGTGFTATVSWLSGGTTSPRAIQSGDLDGDGDRDMVVGRWWQPAGTTAVPMSSQVFLNTGAGTFGPPTALPVVNWTTDLALVDVDADGDLDLVQTAFLYGTNSTSVLMLNDGSGTFTQATGFPGTPASYVAAGDLDGDGDPDLLLDRHVLLNDGSGAFTAGPILAFPGYPQRAILVDADDDGDLDVLEGGWLSVSGGGSFAFPFAVAPAGSWAAVADFDRDGDPDLVIPSPNPRLYSGFARQLTRGDPARPGRPASFDLRGPSLGTWTLFVSTGPAAIPLPPFGTVWIDPAPAIVLGSGAFDTVGRGSWSTVVPTSPSFVGQSFFLQAVVFGGPVPKLTGREIATVAVY